MTVDRSVHRCPRRAGRTVAILSLLLIVLGVADPAGAAPARKGGSGAKARVEAPVPADDTTDDVLPYDDITAERRTGDLPVMREHRMIRALVVYSKTFYFLDGARQRGLTYEALKQFEEFVNKKYATGNLRIQVVPIPVARDELIPGLLEGRGDFAAANLTITPERAAQVDFSDPLMRGVREVVVTGPGAPLLGKIESLAGQEVLVRKSSSYYTSLESLSARLQKAGRKPIVIRAADENFEDEDVLEMMNAGLVKITVVDEHKATFWSTVFKNIRVRRDLAVAEGGEIGWAVRKDNAQLRALINEFVAANPERSTLRNILLKRYLQDNKWVRNPTAQQEMKKFRSTVAFFRKYADRYGFDYLMVTAQAYQESQLDQSRRSHAGAVGVMQVKPSTAAAPPISIRNIQTVDNNVHAGVKYLRHIVETYFDDPAIDPVNRGLFAFAAYNAGPSRVAGLRRQAQAAGLDPNRWFGQVERIAAREIGRETVQYVSNIYKYYVAYRTVAERAEARKAAARDQMVVTPRAKPAQP